MSYLQNINSLGGDSNIGSLISMQVARATDIESMNDPDNDTVYGDIVFKAGKGFVTFGFTSESPRFSSNGKDSQEGSLRENRLDFLLPRDAAVIRDILSRMEEDNFVVLYTDANGKQKVFGSPAFPVSFRYSRDSGARVSDLNHYACVFYSDGPENDFFYEGTITTAPAGAAPVIIKVNGVVVTSAQPGDTVLFTSDFDFDFEIIAI